MKFAIVFEAQLTDDGPAVTAAELGEWVAKTAVGNVYTPPEGIDPAGMNARFRIVDARLVDAVDAS